MVGLGPSHCSVRAMDGPTLERSKICLGMECHINACKYGGKNSLMLYGETKSHSAHKSPLYNEIATFNPFSYIHLHSRRQNFKLYMYS